MGLAGRSLLTYNNSISKCIGWSFRSKYVGWMRRNYAVVGNPTADKALNAITGGRIESWLHKYEDLVGLTEVKEAQNKVIQAENQFQQAQANRRQQQQQLTALHNKLKEIHAALDKVQRGEERYLVLLTEEYEVLREEKQSTVLIADAERVERENFMTLSSAVRESHERERARAERTKYWSIIGSIIGATIGIIGTTINNYRRMRELKSLVRDSASGGVQLSQAVSELLSTSRDQHNELQTMLEKLQFAGDHSLDVALVSRTDLTPKAQTDSPAKTGAFETIRDNTVILKQEVADVKRMVAAISSTRGVGEEAGGQVVYVGPEMKELLAQMEGNLGQTVKSSIFMSSTVTYAACVITAAVVYYIFTGGR